MNKIVDSTAPDYKKLLNVSRAENWTQVSELNEVVEYASILLRMEPSSKELIEQLQLILITAFERRIERISRSLDRFPNGTSDYFLKQTELKDAMVAELERIKNDVNYVSDFLEMVAKAIDFERSSFAERIEVKLRGLQDFLNITIHTDITGRAYILNHEMYKNLFYQEISTDFDKMYFTPGFATEPILNQNRVAVVRCNISFKPKEQEDGEKGLSIEKGSYFSEAILVHELTHCMPTDPGETFEITVDNKSYTCNIRGFRVWIMREDGRVHQGLTEDFMDGKVSVYNKGIQLKSIPQTGMDEGMVILLEAFINSNFNWEECRKTLSNILNSSAGYKTEYKVYVKALLEVISSCSNKSGKTEEEIFKLFAQKYVTSDPYGFLEEVEKLSDEDTYNKYITALSTE